MANAGNSNFLGRISNVAGQSSILNAVELKSNSVSSGTVSLFCPTGGTYNNPITINQQAPSGPFFNLVSFTGASASVAPITNLTGSIVLTKMFKVTLDGETPFWLPLYSVPS